jgi:Tfp pilus assembly protein PilN
MIQINLLPGATKKRTGRRMPQIAALSALSGGLPKLDQLALAGIVTWLTIMPLTGYMFFKDRSNIKALNVRIEGAIADSTKYAGIIAANAKLMQRRDTIARKVNIIQAIDADRYIWPHLMDEMSRALPPYTWLVEVIALQPDSTEKSPKFRIEGRTGNNFALTKYLQDLEASPFIKNVKLASTELVRENDKLVYSFLLEASYEEPPPDVIQTVPLFMKEPE